MRGPLAVLVSSEESFLKKEFLPSALTCFTEQNFLGTKNGSWLAYHCWKVSGPAYLKQFWVAYHSVRWWSRYGLVYKTIVKFFTLTQINYRRNVTLLVSLKQQNRSNLDT